MNPTLLKLKNWGCDMDGAMDRLLQDEELLLSCIQQTAEDAAFDKLGEALRAGDAREAFEQAHMLKGVTANVGLTPLYSILCGLVEPLRAGSTAGVPEQYEQLLEKRVELRGILA